MAPSYYVVGVVFLRYQVRLFHEHLQQLQLIAAVSLVVFFMQLVQKQGGIGLLPCIDDRLPRFEAFRPGIAQLVHNVLLDVPHFFNFELFQLR